MWKILATILICFSVFRANAQSWRALPSGDTEYFVGGTHATTPISLPIGYTSDSGIVRAVCINNVQANGPDTVFHLVRGWRDTTMGVFLDESNCLDSLAPSWLGTDIIRKADGTEYFFNSNHDTITLLTEAKLGDRWLLARDMIGDDFWATVVQAGIMNIDGVADSFKTISIQAFLGAVPIASLYNAQKIQISGQHGLIMTPDLYRFPNPKNEWDYGGIGTDSTQHTRLPAQTAKQNWLQPDISWKYQPGNEWIRQEWITSVTNGHLHRQSLYVTHDSIVSITKINAGLIAVLFQTDSFSRISMASAPPDTVTSGTRMHTDTIATISAQTLYTSAFTFGEATLNHRFFIDDSMGRYYVKARSLRRVGGLKISDSCAQIFPGVSGFELKKADYLEGFGQTYFYVDQGEIPGYELSDEWVVSFLKLGSFTQGKKINVLKLGVAEAPISLHQFRVAPNPANDHIAISSSAAGQDFAMSIRDCTGRCVWRQACKGWTTSIPTSGLAEGLYFVRVSTGQACQSFKISVQH